MVVHFEADQSYVRKLSFFNFLIQASDSVVSEDAKALETDAFAMVHASPPELDDQVSFVTNFPYVTKVNVNLILSLFTLLT